MTHMHPAPELRAFDMQSETVKAPVSHLITKPTELPCGTLFVTVVGIVCTTLTTIVSGELHLQMGPSLFGIDTHCYLIQHGPLH